MNGKTYSLEQASRMLFFTRLCGPEDQRTRRHNETRKEIAQKLRMQSLWLDAQAFRGVGMNATVKENRGMRKAAKRNGIALWNTGSLLATPRFLKGINQLPFWMR